MKNVVIAIAMLLALGVAFGLGFLMNVHEERVTDNSTDIRDLHADIAALDASVDAVQSGLDGLGRRMDSLDMGLGRVEKSMASLAGAIENDRKAIREIVAAGPPAPDVTRAAESPDADRPDTGFSSGPIKMSPGVVPELTVFSPGNWREKRAERFGKKLGLDDTQKEDIQKIWADYAKKRRVLIHELMKEAKENAKQGEPFSFMLNHNHERMKELRDQEQDDIRGVLTPEQYEKYEKDNKNEAFGFIIQKSGDEEEDE
jgi:outer membrane murein-binding lipoprotein Lpp/Spy/CpxP family protein refolding chaperone